MNSTTELRVTFHVNVVKELDRLGIVATFEILGRCRNSAHWKRTIREWETFQDEEKCERSNVLEVIPWLSKSSLSAWPSPITDIILSLRRYVRKCCCSSFLPSRRTNIHLPQPIAPAGPASARSETGSERR